MSLLVLLAACGLPPDEDAPAAETEEVGDTQADTSIHDDTGGAVGSELAGLVINEFLAYGRSDGYAGGADWIEVFNGAGRTLDLSRVTLWADDGNDQLPWLFPAGTTLAPEGFLVVICDDTNQTGTVPHASFRIGRQDGTLQLATEGYVLDTIGYDFQDTGASSARTVDGGPEWIHPATPTPGASNAQ